MEPATVCDLEKVDTKRDSPIHVLAQGFSTSALLTLRAKPLSAAGPPVHWRMTSGTPSPPPTGCPQYNNQTHLQTLPGSPWGQNLQCLENHCSR